MSLFCGLATKNDQANKIKGTKETLGVLDMFVSLITVIYHGSLRMSKFI
jgi:hypothetical protein